MRYPSRRNNKSKDTETQQSIVCCGIVKIYQPIPIVVKLKFKSISRAHKYLNAMALAHLSSLNSYHCHNYTIFFNCTKGIIFLFIGL